MLRILLKVKKAAYRFNSTLHFDEVQPVPSMLRYLQEVLDNSSKRRLFILTSALITFFCRNGLVNHWQNAVLVNEAGEAQYSFYTGDIKGSFSIIAQDFSENEWVNGRESITVQ